MIIIVTIVAIVYSIHIYTIHPDMLDDLFQLHQIRLTMSGHSNFLAFHAGAHRPPMPSHCWELSIGGVSGKGRCEAKVSSKGSEGRHLWQ